MSFAFGSFLLAQSVAAAPPPSSQHPYLLTASTPAGAYMSAADLAQVDAHMQKLVDPAQANVTKGAVVLIAHHGKVAFHKAYGKRDGNSHLCPPMPNSYGCDINASMPIDGIFDLQSMTKPFTSFLILKMAELGLLNLDDEVNDYISGFDQALDGSGGLVYDAAKAGVTIRSLLQYSGGLDIDSATSLYGDTSPWTTMAHQGLSYTPNTSVLYSDITYRLLGHIAEVAYLAHHPSQPQSLRKLVQLYITEPLGMTDTDYEPRALMPSTKYPRFVGTGSGSGGVNYYARGEVQDDQDHWIQRHNDTRAPSGVGCDGLFSTARDLGQFAQMLLNRGARVKKIRDPSCSYVDPLTGDCGYYWSSMLSSMAVQQMTTYQTVNSSGYSLAPISTADNWAQNLLHTSKGYGWEKKDGGSFSPSYRLMSSYTFSKTGGAGTFLTIDPQNDMFTIVLTNHGLPEFSSFGVDPDGFYTWSGFDDMLSEIRPDIINKWAYNAIIR